MTITPRPTNYIDGQVFSASDVNGTNTNVNLATTALSLVDAKGDLLTGISDDTLTKTAVGANNTVLYANSSATGGVSWGLVTSAMITDGTVTGTDIASTTVAASNIVNNTITSTQCKADGAATSIVSVGTALPSATSSKIHFGTTTPASGTGAIGDIYIQY